MGNVLYISHRLFIDDILLFCNVFFRDVIRLKDLFDLYCLETRMEVNEGKSSLTFMGLSDEEKAQFTNVSIFSSGDAGKNKIYRFSHQGK